MYSARKQTSGWQGMVGGWRMGKEGLEWEMDHNGAWGRFWGYRCVYCLDCPDGYVGVYIDQDLLNYIKNMQFILSIIPQ